MAEPRWTAGPWVVDDDHRPGMSYNRHIVLERDPDQRICFMAHDGPARDREFAANARLIAAAPELYAGLLELLDDVETELRASASSHSGRDDDDFREEFPVEYDRCKRLRAVLARAAETTDA